MTTLTLPPPYQGHEFYSFSFYHCTLLPARYPRRSRGEDLKNFTQLVQFFTAHVWPFGDEGGNKFRDLHEIDNRFSQI